MKKNKKLLTNEHLLTDLPNNFALAEEAMKIAYRDLELGKEFSLQGVLNGVVKTHKIEEIIETVCEIEEEQGE
ncbi:MAG: hypothetical protein S4CHLAM20_00440 [Chlamydiia bacterium]|nr:hypothetical protein [Chlamydiia bacterium]